MISKLTRVPGVDQVCDRAAGVAESVKQPVNFSISSFDLHGIHNRTGCLQRHARQTSCNRRLIQKFFQQAHVAAATPSCF
jgi:hypothetical protein